MKLVLAFLSALFAFAFPYHVAAQPYKCVFANGSAVDTKFPCDPATIGKFSGRFAQLYPEVRKEKPTHEYMKNLYVIAIGTCDEPFIGMSPEQIGKNSEPFFPWRMTAAMAQAAREVICPKSK